MADVDMLEGRNDDAIDQLRKVQELGQPTGEVDQATRARCCTSDTAMRKPRKCCIQRRVGGRRSRYRTAAGGGLFNERQTAGGTRYDARQIPQRLDRPDASICCTVKCWEAPNQPDEAEAEFRKAIELAPETAEAWLELIRCW